MRVLVSARTGKKTYHTHSDCRYVGDKHRDWDLETAKEWDYDKCSKCKQLDERKAAVPGWEVDR